MDHAAAAATRDAAAAAPSVYAVAAAAAGGMAQALWLRWGSAADGEPQHQLIALLAAAAVGTALMVWLALDRRCDGWRWRHVVMVALLPRLMLLDVAPLLEDDHHRYLWDGWRTLTALDPYRLPPAAYFGDATLDARWQDVLGGINNPHLPTIYGATLQWLFALAAALHPGSLVALKLLLAGIDAALLALLARAGLPSRWLLLYALHPLVLREASANAHPDALLALALLAALACWRQGRAFAMGIAVGLALATKVAALAALPLLWVLSPPKHGQHWRTRATCGAACALLVVYAPLSASGGSELTALFSFGSEWRFNPLLYRAFEWLGSPLAARAAAAAAVVVVIGLLAWQAKSGAGDEPWRLPPLDAALGAMLVCAPVVNPWYWLWVLPLALTCGRLWAVAAGCVACLSYVNATALPTGGWLVPAGAAPFAVAWPLALVQMAVVAVAVCLQIRGQRRSV